MIRAENNEPGTILAFKFDPRQPFYGSGSPARNGFLFLSITSLIINERCSIKFVVAETVLPRPLRIRFSCNAQNAPLKKTVGEGATRSLAPSHCFSVTAGNNNNNLRTITMCTRFQ